MFDIIEVQGWNQNCLVLSPMDCTMYITVNEVTKNVIVTYDNPNNPQVLIPFDNEGRVDNVTVHSYNALGDRFRVYYSSFSKVLQVTATTEYIDPS